MESLSEAFRSPLLWLTCTVLVIYLYLKYIVYNRWSQKDVPHDVPSIPLGNVPLAYFKGQVLHDDIVKNSYAKYKKFRFHGLYMLCEPVLVITDPQLLQLVLVKNFNEFYNRGALSDVHKDPLSSSILRLYDEKWKRLRGKLTPTFTSVKLKLMYPLISESCDGLIDTFNKELKMSEVIEVKEMIIRYTVDCITSIAFGFNCNSLQNPDNEILKHARISNKLGQIFQLLTFYSPNFVKFMPLPEDRKAVQKFFVKLFEDMVAQRRNSKEMRNDTLQMLIQLMDYGKVQEDGDSTIITSLDKMTDPDKLTMIEGAAQAFFFFAAGFETTASSVISCLYELAFNQDIQDKLFTEIHEVFKTLGRVAYEELSEMKYLDLVYHETLRKHPSISTLNRICTKDFKIPDSNFTIRKGTRIIAPVIGLHSDPDIYPEPDKFDPERFLPENKAKRHHMTYIPFGEGPRQCIGKRLAVMKSKMAILYLVHNYKFSPCEKTDVPMKHVPDYFATVPENVYLKVEIRQV